MYHLANSFAHETPNALWIALALHVLAWYAQIHPGHLVLEGRRPALLQSFFQSLVLAPLFTFFEVLFMLGFKKKLADRIAVGDSSRETQRGARKLLTRTRAHACGAFALRRQADALPCASTLVNTVA